MSDNIPRKKNALLGGLLVFIIPVVLISLIYFSASRFPKPKQIPIITTADSLGKWVITSALDTLQSTDHPVDIKIIFPVDSTSLGHRVDLFNKLTQASKTYPDFSLKEPYAQTYFIGLSPQEFSYPDTLYHWSIYSDYSQFPIPLNEKVIVIDTDGNLRGQYALTQAGIDSLNLDLQYLLQETFYSNADKIKIKRLFKTSEELKNEKQ